MALDVVKGLEVVRVPDGFDVDLTALDQAGQAISQTMHDMKTCEVDDIVGATHLYGHDGLRGAFDHFCDRWQYGVEVLLEDGGKIARALNASMDGYIENDSTVEQTFRAAGVGDDPAREVADG
jgi:hypothetical protein